MGTSSSTTSSSLFSGGGGGPQAPASLRIRLQNISAMRGEIKAVRECLGKRYEKMVTAVAGTGEGFNRVSKWMSYVERPGLRCAPAPEMVLLEEKKNNPRLSLIRDAQREYPTAADTAQATAVRFMAEQRREAATALGNSGKEGLVVLERALRGLEALEAVTWPEVGRAGTAAEKALAAYRKEFFKVKEWTAKYEKARGKAKAAGAATPGEFESKLSAHRAEEKKRLHAYNTALQDFDRAYEAAIATSAKVGRETAEMWETEVCLYLSALAQAWKGTNNDNNNDDDGEGQQSGEARKEERVLQRREVQENDTAGMAGARFDPVVKPSTAPDANTSFSSRPRGDPFSEPFDALRGGDGDGEEAEETSLPPTTRAK